MDTTNRLGANNQVNNTYTKTNNTAANDSNIEQALKGLNLPEGAMDLLLMIIKLLQGSQGSGTGTGTGTGNGGTNGGGTTNGAGTTNGGGKTTTNGGGTTTDGGTTTNGGGTTTNGGDTTTDGGGTTTNGGGTTTNGGGTTTNGGGTTTNGGGTTTNGGGTTKHCDGTTNGGGTTTNGGGTTTNGGGTTTNGGGTTTNGGGTTTNGGGTTTNGGGTTTNGGGTTTNGGGTTTNGGGTTTNGGGATTNGGGKTTTTTGGGATTEAGKVHGDPHFVGAEGGKYDVHGTNGKTYNLLSDKGIQMNALFGRDGSDSANVTYIKQAGIKLGNDQVQIDKNGDLSINGQKQGDGTYLNGAVTKNGSGVQVNSSEYQINFKSVDNHLDFDFKKGNVLSDGVRPHGLWGQTADGDGQARNGDTGANAQGGGAIDGANGRTQRGDRDAVKLYEVGNIFDTNFANFNRFNG